VIRVATTPVEVIRIAEWLAQNRTEEELAALRSQLRDYCLAVEARYFETRRPCPFLTDASFCGIYEVRPVSCRGYFSFDLSACIEHFQQNLPSRIPKLDDTLVFGQTISAGLSRATPGEPRFVDLHKSVLRALEPGARERFLAGEVIFADCAVT
jgi:Fe-S-cluster containining protein